VTLRASLVQIRIAAMSCIRRLNHCAPSRVLFVAAFVWLFWELSLSCAADEDGQPHLLKHGSATQLVVDGRPFLILGGELGNSSTSSRDYMEPYWANLKKLNLNTVLAPVCWDLIEPEEGKFDFSLVDGLLEDARKYDVRLVLLWFATWKNSMSCYSPAWVKADQQRFPRCQGQSGRGLEILSPFSTTNRDADLRAFAALMRHLRDVDSQRHTVLMVQVENEIGMIPDARDHSAAANKLYSEPVPKELTDYIAAHKDSLATELAGLSPAGGSKKSGTWEEVFGSGPQTEELFMAWHFARYVEAIAAAGKHEYSLPMYLNAALIRPDYPPGKYPSGGPLPHLIDVWRAGAPSIDFLAPDIYFPNFAEWCQKYAHSGNPLFVPEAERVDASAAHALYAIGAHDAIGFSPFSIESIDAPEKHPLRQSYDLLSQLTPLIVEHQGTGTMAGVLLDQQNQKSQVQLGDYRLNVVHDYTLGWFSKEDGERPWPPAGGLIVALGSNEYLVAGSGVVVTFDTAATDNSIVGIASIQEGRYKNGQWTGGRWLNGDQSHQGRHLRIPAGQWSIQRVKLYRYL
jgi:beta-galactosidase GanA